MYTLCINRAIHTTGQLTIEPNEPLYSNFNYRQSCTQPVEVTFPAKPRAAQHNTQHSGSIPASEIYLPTLRSCRLRRTIWTFERPWIALCKLLDGLFAQHMPASHEHGRVVLCTLLAWHGACKYGVELVCFVELNFNRHLFQGCPLLHALEQPLHQFWTKAWTRTAEYRFKNIKGNMPNQ